MVDLSGSDASGSTQNIFIPPMHRLPPSIPVVLLAIHASHSFKALAASSIVPFAGISGPSLNFQANTSALKFLNAHFSFVNPS